MAKRADTDPPSDREKDPHFMAMQIRALRGAVDNLMEVQKTNLKEIAVAFTMVDMHQQVLMRVARDTSAALVNVRRLQTDGDVTLSGADFLGLRTTPEGELDVTAYYNEYAKVVETAGEAHAEKAVAFWARGCSIEESVERAKLSDEAELAEEPSTEEVYEVEHFGGTNGQGSHEQKPAIQTGG